MATVRRDVDELASRGVLQKTRGGVILQARETASLDPTYAMRLSVNMDERTALRGRPAPISTRATTLCSIPALPCWSWQSAPVRNHLGIITYDLYVALELVNREYVDLL